MKLFRCQTCGNFFERRNIWFLPYAGQRCYGCAIDFLAYYKANAATLATKVMGFTLTQKIGRGEV